MSRQYSNKPARRLWCLNAVLVFFGLVVVARLFQIQVVQHGKYSIAAAETQSRKFTVPAKRGDIYILDGAEKTPLVLTQTLKIIYADPTLIENKSEVARKLAQVTGDKVEDYEKALDSDGSYVVLKRKVNHTMAEKVFELNIYGVGLSDQQVRTYPEGSLASQLLGFVNSDGAGQYGIEGYMNEELSGTPGLLKIKTDTHGNPIAIANNFETPAVNGKGYVLTIDRNIQAQVEKFLKAGVENVRAKSGSVLVIDPYSGAVKAMANYPSYDPGNYGVVTDYQVFSNDVVSNQFEPGSGFKVFTMAAALGTGKVKPETTYVDTGVVEVDGYTIHNSSNKKYGEQNMVQVIEKSLNTGVIHILKLLGGDPENINLAGKKILYDYIKRFGFGAATGIEQTGEASGAVNLPTKQSGNNVNYANMTFGQGISVTMTQMVSAVAATVNGGKLYKPYMIDRVVLPDLTEQAVEPKLVADSIVTPEISKQLVDMMVQVVERGSGWPAKYKGYRIGGKTGTAQIPKADGKGYEDGKNIGTFVGFAPAENPRFVMMVRINEPKVSGFAESTTVPIFANIAHWLLRYYQVPPTG